MHLISGRAVLGFVGRPPKGRSTSLLLVGRHKGSLCYLGALKSRRSPVRTTLLAQANQLHNWLSYGERPSPEDDCQIF